MGKLKDDFLGGTQEQQIKYCRFYIEEAAANHKSKEKIVKELKKVSASENVIKEAFETADADLPTENEKATYIANKIISDNGGKITPTHIRKVAAKLAYLEFEEEIIYEIIDRFQTELQWD